MRLLKHQRERIRELRSFPRSSEHLHLCTEDMEDRTLLDEALGDYRGMERLSDNDGGVSVVLVESSLKREQEM